MRVPYFDNAEVEHDEADDEVTDPARAASALAAFLALTPADRLADSRHVWANYRNVHQTIGGDEWLDPVMGVPAGPAQIWGHVQPRRLAVQTDYGPDNAHFIAVSCACDWDEEGGLYLVWRDGARLSKVGCHDGHLTNAPEFDVDVVHASPDAEFVTRLDS